MRFPAEIPPSIPTVLQEHILKSCTCLLSIISLHFLQYMACLVCVYRRPPYIIEGIFILYLYKNCVSIFALKLRKLIFRFQDVRQGVDRE